MPLTVSGLHSQRRLPMLRLLTASLPVSTCYYSSRLAPALRRFLRLGTDNVTSLLQVSRGSELFGGNLGLELPLELDMSSGGLVSYLYYFGVPYN